MKKLNIVVISAHIDDHWLGMGGTMLKAARKGHNVSVIQAVSTYCAWPVVTGRDAEFNQASAELTKKTGIQVVGLGHDYQRLVSGPELVMQISRLLVDLKADIVFCPLEHDINQDHAVLGRAACLAATGAFSYLPPEHALMKLPRQVFQYSLDINALHKSFRPDAYVNVSDVFFETLEQNNIFDELYSKSPLWPDSLKRMTITEHPSKQTSVTFTSPYLPQPRLGKERSVTLNSECEYFFARALIHGLQCGARYADAFSTYVHTPADEDLLSLI